MSSSRRHLRDPSNNTQQPQVRQQRKVVRSRPWNMLFVVTMSALLVVVCQQQTGGGGGSVLALQSLNLPKFTFPKFSMPTTSTTSQVSSVGGGARDLEQRLIETIDQQGTRLGSTSEEENTERIILDLIQQLETSKSSILQPAIAQEVYGRWRLIYTTNTDTSSPIQRKAVDASKFPIYQDIVFNDLNQLVVKQVVQFNDKIQLSVDALASTEAYPLAELTEPRKTTGKVFGINVLGVSLVGDEAQPDPNRPNSRIDFVFDEGNFDFSNGLKIPYPVPFRFPLFRDWVKGWIDITYLSPTMRISRGNKGTAFVLIKEDE